MLVKLKDENHWELPAPHAAVIGRALFADFPWSGDALLMVHDFVEMANPALKLPDNEVVAAAVARLRPEEEATMVCVDGTVPSHRAQYTTTHRDPIGPAD